MPIAYHSDCCPLMSRELALLILQAYRFYYDARKKHPLPAHLDMEFGQVDLIAPLTAKVLPLSRNKIFGFVGVKDKTAYVVFRGTESVSEWVGDSRFLQVEFVPGWGKVHKGFRIIYKTCSPQVMAAIEALPDDIEQVVIAGHSLGGALATLACIEILEHTRFKNPILYTFASPRVGSVEFAKKFEQAVPQSYRIMNTEDIIITEPKAATVGKLWQYAHVGIPLAFSHHGGSILENHMLESYMNHL